MVKNIIALTAVCILAAPAEPIQLDPPANAVEATKPSKKKKEEKAKPDKKEAKQSDKKKPAQEKKDKPKSKKDDKKPSKKDKTAAKPEAKPSAKPQSKPAPDKNHRPKGMPSDEEIKQAKMLHEALTVMNALELEKQKQATNGLRSEIDRLKLEKELLTEKLALATMKQSDGNIEAMAKYEAEKNKLTREATLAKIEAENIAAKLKAVQAASSLKTTEMMAEIDTIEATKKRDDYANAKPQYLDNPLKKDGTLVVSDRRIPFNGPVTSTLADRVTTRINYFNNKDPKKPIFIVIDDSPGGSVMAGYRILKAMEGSEAPVYVIVKSFAASMAATITTLAEKSYVYPNAIILHHQISQSFMFSSMNLTEQKENVEDLKKWWARLADPIAEKMGVTSDEFIEMMYQKTVSGDWTEFGDDAVKLKWADHVVNRIHETSLLKNPDAKKAVVTTRSAAIENGLTPAVDENGNPYMILPRRNPKDVYMMHNPDGFYRFK